MKKVRAWARWNQRTRQLAPLGDLIGYPPNLYGSKEEALKTIKQYGTIGEEVVVEVSIQLAKRTRS